LHRLLIGSALVFLAVGLAPAAQAANFTVDQQELDFSSNAGVPIPSQSFTVTNNDTQNGVTVSVSPNASFISVSARTLSLTKKGGNNSVGSVTVNIQNGLPVGNYSGSITLTGGGETLAVAINVQISGVNISVAPASASVNVQQGSRTSTGFVISGGPSAISVSASGEGLSGGSANAPGSFTAQVDATNLAPGNHSGTLSFSCVGGSPCVPQVVSISINVIAPVQLVVSRNSFSFQAYQGRPAPAAQSVSLSTTGGTTSFNAQNVPAWLQVTPANGNASSAATAVTLTLIPSALTLGSNVATISFGSSSAASVTVSATLLKLSLSVNPTSVSATLDPGQTKTIPLTIATADNGPVAVTTAATTSKGGQWIKLASTDFMAPGPVPVITLDATGLAAGTYGGTITYSCAPNSQVDCGQTAVPVNLTVTATAAPVITPGGLVVASSFGGLKTVGPGTYIEIYGQNLATTTTGWGPFFVNNVAPTTVQGVGVKINGESAFVNFVSPGQVNALVPGDVSAGSAQVTVSNAQGTSAPFTVNVAPQQPTLLAPASFMVSGKQYVGAFLPPDYATTFALPAGAIAGVTSRPAKPGETLVLYGLGFGAVTPDVPVGTIAPALQFKLNSPLQILFNQSAGTIAYSGLAPGFVGLYQINVQVPQIADSDAVPLTFTLGGTPGTQTLYIAVHQ
jgi:uncharacterized protein (TIGR03437 family)